MNDSIPANKSKSRIKPLENKILSLEQENESLKEEMYDNGLRTRPSIMTQIEEIEASTLKSIQWKINECEKETGRKFDLFILCNSLT